MDSEDYVYECVEVNKQWCCSERCQIKFISIVAQRIIHGSFRISRFLTGLFLLLNHHLPELASHFLLLEDAGELLSSESLSERFVAFKHPSNVQPYCEVFCKYSELQIGHFRNRALKRQSNSSRTAQKPSKRCYSSSVNSILITLRTISLPKKKLE